MSHGYLLCTMLCCSIQHNSIQCYSIQWYVFLVIIFFAILCCSLQWYVIHCYLYFNKLCLSKPQCYILLFFHLLIITFFYTILYVILYHILYLTMPCCGLQSTLLTYPDRHSCHPPRWSWSLSVRHCWPADSCHTRHPHRLHPCLSGLQQTQRDTLKL